MTGIIKILPLIILFLFQDNTPKSDYSLMKHINNKGNFITVDELGSLFLVNGNNLKNLTLMAGFYVRTLTYLTATLVLLMQAIPLKYLSITEISRRLFFWIIF